MVNKVIVSTNDSEIASISKSYGAEVVLRPNEISNDTAQSEDALLHCIDFLNSNYKYVPDLIVFLQATSPIRIRTDIDQAIKKLIESDADSLFLQLLSIFVVDGKKIKMMLYYLKITLWQRDP